MKIYNLRVDHCQRKQRLRRLNKHTQSSICHQDATKSHIDVNKMSTILPFSIFIIFEHLTIKSWCSMPEDEQRLSASPFEEYFWRDTRGMCSPEQAQFKGGKR